MFRLHSTSPKNGKPGRLKIREITHTVEAGFVDRVLIDIEMNVPSPYKYVVKHKTGKYAKMVREGLLEAGLLPAQCDIILKAGKYDPRNGELHSTRPEEFVSRSRSLAAQIRAKVKRFKEREAYIFDRF
ncbi:hypothetical protein ACP6H1_27435 [Vibrio harveyi]|uniref:hypothetical protein n=1 Tax=Vibrio harveyi TaxID=669 RepID=UPI003CEE3E6C